MWLAYAALAAVCFGFRGILYQWTSQKRIERNLMPTGTAHTFDFAPIRRGTLTTRAYRLSDKPARGDPEQKSFHRQSFPVHARWRSAHKAAPIKTAPTPSAAHARKTKSVFARSLTSNFNAATANQP